MLIETAVAVALSSVRFLPIVVALLPLVRRENAQRLAASRAGAFHGDQRLGRGDAARARPAARAPHPVLQRHRRDAAGLGVVFTAVGYYMQSLLPALFGAAAMFITPISFLVSTARNARAAAGQGCARARPRHRSGAGLQPGAVRSAVDRRHRRHAGLWRCIACSARRKRGRHEPSPIEPYLVLILVGFLPSEVWRWLGIVLGRGLDENSEIILWVRGVATALIAAVVARIVLIPPGALAACRCRCGSRRWRCGFLAFLFIRRSAFAGVLVGEAVLVTGALAFGS